MIHISLDDSQGHHSLDGEPAILLRVTPLLPTLSKTCHRFLRQPFCLTVGLFLLACLFNPLALPQATAQDISVKLSARKAYLGGRLTLTVTITDAESHQIPELPKIEGCRFEQLGPPRQSTQQFAFNGFSQISKSMTYRFALTPQRAGEFEIPEMTFLLEGKKRVLEAVKFVAEKSETGDLLFVEVESDRESIFVGESLPLTLKIWLKPYRDEDRNVTLSISDMFNLISDSSNWGVFEETLRATDPRKGRVNAKKVQRENANGELIEYYLYEVPAQLYTKKEGPVAIGNVSIVCDYPTSLRVSRSMFGSMFDDRQRLAISASRPIAANAITDTLLAKPIPTEGRPDDYRGAIGKYRIMTSTSDRTVYEGDPIQLRIGIIGDGPMDLLPAPPLASINQLTDDFKVADQPLAGVVQGREKIFPATIRPNSDGVTEIPPIPLSYFDPKTESFETVYSDPIPITVIPMNSISLSELGGPSTAIEAAVDQPNDTDRMDGFKNDYSSLTLEQTESKFAPPWWWYTIIGPPVLCLTTLAISWIPAIANLVLSLRSAQSICRSAIQRSQSGLELVSALTTWIGRRNRKTPQSSEQAIGILRAAGLHEEAIELEMFFDSMQANELHDANERQAAKEKTILWMESLSQSFTAKPRRLRPAKVGQLLLWLVLMLIPNTTQAVQTAAQEPRFQSVLREANDSYQTGRKTQNAAEKKSAFENAAEKYQWLIDQGVCNSRLYLNAGNAYAQINDYPRAIANYRRVLRMEPNQRNAQSNLERCFTGLEQSRANKASPNKAGPNEIEASVPGNSGTFSTAVDSMLSGTLSLIGRSGLLVITGLASLSFWGLMTAALIRRRRQTSRGLLGWTLLPMVVLFLCGGLMFLDYEHFHANTAVVINDSLELREGDGLSFPIFRTWPNSAGETVNVLTNREGWAEVKCPDGTIGWTRLRELELILPVSQVNHPTSIAVESQTL